MTRAHGISLDWFLPLTGDSRTDIALGSATNNDPTGRARPQREPRIDYLAQLARASESLGYEAVLVPAGSGYASGSYWTGSKDGFTCFTMRITVDAIETEPSDCGGDLESLAQRLYGDPDREFIALDRVPFRPHVDIADNPAPICQCYSGSPCDCPGG